MNRKQLLFFTIPAFMAIGLTLFAESYNVYRVRGNVVIRRADETLIPERRMMLEFHDAIIQQEESEISILERPGNRIYNSKYPGEHSIKSIIATANDQANSRSAAINSELRRQVKNKAKAVNTYTAMGASTRGLYVGTTNDIEYTSIENDIAENIAEFLHQPTLPKMNPSEIKLTKTIDPENNTFYFSIQNNLDKTIEANIYSVDINKRLTSICYEIKDSLERNIILPGQSSVDINSIIFAEDSITKYLLVACEASFDPEQVINSMQNKAPRSLKNIILTKYKENHPDSIFDYDDFIEYYRTEVIRHRIDQIQNPAMNGVTSFDLLHLYFLN